MKTARESISIFASHNALKRLIDECENFDAASKLCADYCITADDVAMLVDKTPKPKRSKSRLTFVARFEKNVGAAYLMMARQFSPRYY
jgi:hypothetical protein